MGIRDTEEKAWKQYPECKTWKERAAKCREIATGYVGGPQYEKIMEQADRLEQR